MRTLNDSSIELRGTKNGVLAAATRFPMHLWVVINCVFCVSYVILAMKSWTTVSIICLFLIICFNVLALLMNNDWVCAFVKGEFVVRVIAPPLLFKSAKYAKNWQNVVMFSLTDIQRISAQRIDIQEQAGTISTNWFTFDIKPDAMNGVKDIHDVIRAECIRKKRPVLRLLRYNGERCFLRWDQIKMPLNKFLDQVSVKYPTLRIDKSENLVLDVRQLAMQSENERRSKIHLLFDLGLGMLIVPYLTANGGMESTEAKQYVNNVLGIGWPSIKL